MVLRVVLLIAAVAGALVAALGAVLSVGVLILVGSAALVVALVMGVLAVPATRR